ncbi:PrsW family intramembrane metalloprotease [Halorientalis regularis]|jgi:RsiW-degrading membrane proteinase PrsW (M82 family)|uniref:Membrane proteinase PrsW, cleaves anti-sigma factor RsiW, M82 family n=1 Tax=Halorientalis regularis TaxID=660518 RepID=A0A1G7L0S7_9EURY|nr:PrsW family glutamic-type intramembrane protease [Halorientalis regularis]SDF43053.1 Membrane proteinase PrsW, cleaves anti-sigma factor RsiW, M82 family [Halorientalis regularis]
MDEERDPVQSMDDGSMDLYEISEWETRSGLDRFAQGLYHAAIVGVRWTVVVVAVLILGLQVVLGGFGLLVDPRVGTFVALSIVPAFVLAAYLWRADVTTSEPLEILVVTFLLGILFANFAGILNDTVGQVVRVVGSGFGLVPILGLLALYFLVVGPVEEAVKLLAVRMYAYRMPEFDAVIDGAVYGAVAGLGFATIENALYITNTLQMVAPGMNLIQAGSDIATIRALAGPGHVIYSAFAGYYLGLAKFNPDDAGPIVVKGLLIATLVHATYNTCATVLVPIVASVTAVDTFVVFLSFVVLYDGLFVYLLLRKLSTYNDAYRRANRNDEPADSPDLG